MWKEDEETKENWIRLNEQVKRVHKVEESQYEVTRTEVAIAVLFILMGILMITDALGYINVNAWVDQIIRTGIR